MADTIKIPYGFVIAASNEEYASMVASVKTCLELMREGTDPQDEVSFAKLEKLLHDLLTMKSQYGTESMN